MSLYFDQYSIRLARHSDLPAYFNLIERNRPRLEDFFAGTVALTQTLDDTASHLADVIAQADERKHFPFLVFDENTGSLIASIQVKNLDWAIPKGELGYYIDAAYEGRGVVTKAVSRIIRFCFDELGLNKVFIRTHEGNVSSRRVAEKNGLIHEGTIRKDYKTTRGEVVDLMYYGLVREEFEAGAIPATKSSAGVPFQVIDWAGFEQAKTIGETGFADSRTVEVNGLRIRILEYSAGYLADHWCRKGHLVHCLAGSFITEMEDGSKYPLREGMSYVVSDGLSSHRSYSENGTKLLIVDGDFLAVR